jgi:exodeoxyribonuclease VII small subunit
MTEKTFEEALEELESKVEALSAGHMPLADALRAYEEGVALVRLCSARLEEAELKVSRLASD